jgi:hypothetical protein
VVITATSDVTDTVYDTAWDSVFVRFAPQFEFARDAVGTGTPWETITYTHRITNTGNGQDTYHFTATVVGAMPLTVTITPDNVTLPVSDTAQITVSVTLPGPAQAISGTVGTALIVARSGFSEAVRSAVTDTTTVRQVQGLRLQPTSATGSGQPGQGVAYAHSLEQLGNFTETAVFTYAGVPIWDVSLPFSHTLVPGAMVTFTVRVTVPLDSQVGITNVTHITATLQESAGVSTTAVDTTTTALRRQVMIEPPDAANARPGQVVTYSHTITNLGNLTDTFSISLSSGSFTGTLVSGTPMTLAAFASAPITVTVQVPSVVSGTAQVLTVTATSQYSPTTAFDTVTDTTTAGLLPGVIIEPDRQGRLAV